MAVFAEPLLAMDEIQKQRGVPCPIVETSPAATPESYCQFRICQGAVGERGVEEAKVTVRHLGVNTERFTPDPGARTRWAEQFFIGADGSGMLPSRRRCCKPRISSSWPRWARRSGWCWRRACGVPIVGSRSGSLTEVVEEKETGLLTPQHDAAAFADSIEQLARDGRLRKDMGHRALECVRQNFTVDRDAEGTLGMYALL